MQSLQAPSTRQVLSSSLFCRKLSTAMVSYICEYLISTSIACLAATERSLKADVEIFVLRKWNYIGLHCSYEKLYLNKEYFSALAKEMGDMPFPTLSRKRSSCFPFEESQFFCSQQTLSSRAFLSEPLEYEPKKSFMSELTKNNLAERVHSPLERLHILERISREITNKHIFLLITKLYDFRSKSPTTYGDSSLSERRLFKLIQTWNVRKEAKSIDREKGEAINSVLHVSRVSDIDVGMLTILLKNDAFDSVSTYPASFISYILNKMEFYSDDYDHIKVILNLFCDYNIDLNIPLFLHTPIQKAGARLIERALFLYSHEKKEGTLFLEEVNKALSQIHMSAKIIKFLIKKGISTEQIILSEGKEMTESESRTLLKMAQDAIKALKGLKYERAEIIKELQDIIHLCLKKKYL